MGYLVGELSSEISVGELGFGLSVGELGFELSGGNLVLGYLVGKHKVQGLCLPVLYCRVTLD